MAITVSKQDAISFVISFAPKYRSGQDWTNFSLSDYNGEAVDGSTMTSIPGSYVRAANANELALFVDPVDAADSTLRHLRVFIPGGPGFAETNGAEFRIILSSVSDPLDRTTIYKDQVTRL